MYIPIKDDAVDKKLAEFINNYPERSKLKIMFMRESEGVYQFGTKRVYVRVDKDKINSKFNIIILWTLTNLHIPYHIMFIEIMITKNLYSSCWRWLLINWWIFGPVHTSWTWKDGEKGPS